MARRLLLPLVFVSGMASLGVEFGASRLLAPYFGTSLYVWGVLIGLILIYLSAGYVLGGRLADRYPRPELLFQLTAWAGLWVGVIPLVAYPILLASQQGFATINAGLVIGTLAAVVLLFAVPVVLLGCVSPFAIRLLLTDVESGGNTAGAVYALSTAGSILGTFLPVFWFIPTYGTRPTLIGFSIALLIPSVLGLWPVRRLRWYVAFAAIVLVAAALLPPQVKPPEQGRLVYEKDSPYQYIQVVQVGSKTELVLNEGQAIHSIYDPTSLVTGGPWDYMLIGNAFRSAGASVAPRRVLILGLAGGTAAAQLRNAFPTVDITGVEIDPDVVDVAGRYFHLGETGTHVEVQDARYWLATRPASDRYDLVIMDAYRQPYIPFHLTTKEFFDLVRAHLTPGGVAVVNAGRTAHDFRLVDALASTMRASYDGVFLVDVPDFSNTLIYGTTEGAAVADVTANLRAEEASGPLYREVAESALFEGNLRASPYHGQVFTDDLAPVERIIDEIILGYIAGER
ncbi:MAG TPA: fused MFS/spermidine synthase [Candidatus Dormibacteraeota bacterium]